ncbi:MAG: hypothetical protein KatS3mg012_2520 [Gaiellaceae bacterium]|jgi:hypothetical protein|nr:MAG: hypothetical protein KatS3mg012_2520 [Gaiellaceae bacterium]
MRLARPLVTFTLGAYAGLAIAAALMKRALAPRGDAGSDEVALVAIFDGVRLASRAQAFRGGSLLAWFGGIDLDLSAAGLAPGARLRAAAVLGGVSIRVPTGWRVRSEAKALLGGIDVRTGGDESPDAPTLVVEGLALLGGIAIVAARDATGTS